MTTTSNPFAGPKYGDNQTYHTDAESRANMVKQFDRAQCEAAMQVPGLQKIVERAVQVRLRAIAKAEGVK